MTEGKGGYQEVVVELTRRLNQANHYLTEMAEHNADQRLHDKAEGVRLALSYLAEELRLDGLDPSKGSSATSEGGTP